ncbi:tRNA 5-carboxymethoxyuridine methyltransferase [Alteromonas sp. KUL156]|uniref:methyltransferase n=1 Tax=Alteromonas sp. KUL106 TaxID=2480799 RepID=UPI0012E45533|nr:methyltransferase [Alteromonas sp. KUL106]GFD68430.1 tRNA 5-carboxymethoxyuridine methyltransferase [Alteromonas sp. KUL106]GFD94061.1 tRNA 5-carboxymethoxyuridine methyltransferase [Alteromonas sp. KUL154]GFD97780.1 tRNA 5-carboxymethoxyuridine methyltransferase [Alteromonas sp. KUL156]
MNNDRIFDGIAEKFSNNIYGTTKGKLRHTLLCDVLSPYLTTPLRAIEIGGGTGVMTAHIASMGHAVTLTDASKDVLEQARAVLGEFDNITIKQQYLQAIEDLANYDLVVCHAVLEWLEAPFDAIDFIFHNMRPGACLSLSFFNQDANLFANAIYGNFDYIAKGMKVKKQVRLNPKQPLSAMRVVEHCEKLGFEVLEKAGIRCFHDYMRDTSHQSSKFDDLLALERQYHKTEPYMWLGKYFHLMLKKL